MDWNDGQNPRVKLVTQLRVLFTSLFTLGFSLQSNNFQFIGRKKASCAICYKVDPVGSKFLRILACEKIGSLIPLD
jgi:hypothetical protein